MADPAKMSRSEFLKQLKQQMPALKDFSDDQIMQRVLERKPEIADKVELGSPTMKQVGSNEPDSYWKGFANSVLSGEARKAGDRSAAAYLKGAIADAPAGVMGALKYIGDFATSSPVSWAQRVASDVKNVPLSILEKIGSTAEMSGSKPEDFGRVMGQTFGQPAVIGAAGELVPKIATSPTMGRILDKTGGLIKEYSPKLIPGIAKPAVVNDIAEQIGNRMQGIGQAMHRDVPKELQNMRGQAPSSGITINEETGPFDRMPIRSITRPNAGPPRVTGKTPTLTEALMDAMKPVTEQPNKVTLPPQPGETMTPSVAGKAGYTTGNPSTGELDLTDIGEKVDPAAEFAKKFGTPNDETMIEDLAERMAKDAKEKPPQAPEDKAIIQHSPDNPGTLRGSLDGGRTWRYSTDNGETWSMIEP